MYKWVCFAIFMMINTLSFAQNNLQTLSAYRIVMLQLEGNAPQRLSLEQALHQHLQRLPNFTVNHESLLWLGQQAKREQLFTMQELLSATEKELLELESSAYPNLKRVQQLKQLIKQKRKALEKYQQSSPNYRITDKLPIEVQRRSTNILSEEDRQEFGINFWIYGQVVSVESQRVFLELKGYDVMHDEEILLYRGAFDWNTHQQMIVRAVDTVRDRLLGRDWAALEILNTPTTNYRIQWQDLDGKPRMAALPQAYLENLEVESGRLRLHVVGYQRQEWILLLTPNQRRSLNFEAIPSQADDRFIQVNLIEAGIYLDGIYQGVAPLTVQANAGQTLTVTDPSGERPPIMRVITEQDEEIFLRFGLTINQQRELIARQQQRFYVWAGVFIVSLVLPIVFYNMYLDYKQKARRYEQLNQFEQQGRAIKTANIYTYLTIGTGVLSGALFGVTIYQLYRYVEVTKEPLAEEHLEAD